MVPTVTKFIIYISYKGGVEVGGLSEGSVHLFLKRTRLLNFISMEMTMYSSQNSAGFE